MKTTLRRLLAGNSARRVERKPRPLEKLVGFVSHHHRTRGLKVRVNVVDARTLRVPYIKNATLAEPLAALQNKLKQLEKIRRVKFSAYAVAASSAAILAAYGHSDIATGALGSISVLK